MAGEVMYSAMEDVVQTRYRVSGMDCGSCAAKVDAAVRRLPGVEQVSVSAATSMMTVHHRPDPALYPAMKANLKGLGYGLAPADAAAGPGRSARPEDSVPWWRTTKGLLTLSCAGALVPAYVIGQLVPTLERPVFVAALAIGLVPIGRRAVAVALAGSPFTIETLMTIAAVGAVLIGATEEAATVIFLFLVGELLEGVAAGRARAGIRALSELTPKTALLEQDGEVIEIAAAKLVVGSTIRVRPGDRLPADGEVIEGESGVDEAPISGESVPIRKRPGSAVFAGSINGDGLLRIRVTAAAQDNTIARVVRLVEEAQESKSATERLIDRVARYYTPAVMAVAALIAIAPPLLAGAVWSEWIYKGLAVLLIGCPCALVISTPAAISAALSAGARRGLLIKGGAVLETIGRVNAVALDKTGTLTRGRPEVSHIVALTRNEKQILSLAAALEAGSSHPLAIAIRDRAKAERAPVPPAAEVRALPGEGVSGRIGGTGAALVSAQAAIKRAELAPEQHDAIERLQRDGNTVSVLLVDDKPAALIAMRDEPRTDAKAGLDALVAAGVQPIMLTGDNRRTAAIMGNRLGIEFRAELLPEDKQRIVREMQSEGRTVAKVGDGINDAPALAAANVGIAMGGGTDVALEAADSAILHDRVLDIAAMIGLGRRAMANIRQNIAIALGLKAVFLVTTIIGVTGLWSAILADTGATVLVTANALRLLRPAD